MYDLYLENCIYYFHLQQGLGHDFETVLALGFSSVSVEINQLVKSYYCPPFSF